MMRNLSADIAVLGSGFAGNLTALIADRLGIAPLVVDKATHPRFAIGESSTPIANMILRDLADRYHLPQLRPLSTYGTWQETYPQLVAGRKRGFSYFHHRPDEPFRHDRSHSSELLVTASSDSYYCDTQWMRSDVDAFLAEQVREAGIPLLEGTEITSIEPGDSGWRLRGNRAGEPVAINAQFIVDGTGASGVLSDVLDLKDRTHQIQTHSRALFSHFSGVKPWQEMLGSRKPSFTGDHPFPCGQAALHHVAADGWMWILRFNNGVVSAGMVRDSRRHPMDAHFSPEDEWSAWIDRYPSIRRQFADADVVDPPGTILRTGRLQRKYARAAGSSWVLLPHTAGFVDPIHSTGIAHSLAGIERLAHILSEHWGKPTLRQALDTYEQAVLQELSFIDDLAALFYQSLGDFRLMSAATMFYFAAVTTYERLRVRYRDQRSEEPFGRLFLCAGDLRLQHVTAEAFRRLSAYEERGGAAAGDAFERYASTALAPYNEVGLFEPPVHNMYPYTAAPEGL